MGTNAKIKVEGLSGVSLYKHFDGYPESTLPWLQKFSTDFKENRGDDPSYKMAQLIRSSISDAPEFSLDPNKYTGWGILTSSNDHECQFHYLLKRDGTITYVQND